MTEVAPRIVIDDEIHGGKPVIKGTRVPVQVIVGHLAAGMPIEEVCQEYGITVEDVRAALAFAADLLGDETIRAVG